MLHVLIITSMVEGGACKQGHEQRFGVLTTALTIEDMGRLGIREGVDK